MIFDKDIEKSLFYLVIICQIYFPVFLQRCPKFEAAITRFPGSASFLGHVKGRERHSFLEVSELHSPIHNLFNWSHNQLQLLFLKTSFLQEYQRTVEKGEGVGSYQRPATSHDNFGEDFLQESGRPPSKMSMVMRVFCV